VKIKGITVEYLVWWNIPDNEDPANPRNWSNLQKWTIIASLSLVTFLTYVTEVHRATISLTGGYSRPLASSVSAPSVPQMLIDFKTHLTFNVTCNLCNICFCAGFRTRTYCYRTSYRVDCRVLVYHACNVLFLIFTILCAVSKTMAMLIVFWFMAGFAGVVPITYGSGTTADLVPIETRGVAMSLWPVGPLFGDIIGPVAGGFLVEAKTGSGCLIYSSRVLNFWGADKNNHRAAGQVLVNP
jgi:MFS family permease